MANIIGESGAWLDIWRKLQRIGLQVGSPGEIQPLLVRLRENLAPSMAMKRHETEALVYESEDKIALLRAEKGIFRFIVNWFAIQGLKSDIARFQSRERCFVADLHAQIFTLERLSDSPELGGALAELAVMEALKRLPPDHAVINDVRLVASRFIRYDGKPLQSAQIDHLVLSPAGVFVIETKCWTRAFADSGMYHNPFDQVRRSSYLCHAVLKENFGNIRVRSIIACAGHLPAAGPDQGHVKVLRALEINGYITWFKKEELSKDRQARLQQYFENRSNRI